MGDFRENAFISLKTQKPNVGDVVICKLNDEFTPYYVCTYDVEPFTDGYLVFIEASGEQYCRWEENEVIGWLPVHVLDSLGVR